MYKERGQLSHRQHLGILEKKKDYKRRSADFKNKNNIIKKLGLKAELRNPDEFYHKMHAARNVDGEHRVMLKGNQQKSRKLNEDRNIAIVNMKR
eukprot:CAMPEP_0185569862 /NCGR_PEP_ID=MMETSP0434-20130131/2367_1 /TAXON_ID=626734 ORGANISM="Favella taraikaensis, Strain Fe Narragansett Bay" /NCGR_SAMPLE_ID=MMETSP0434 /ASSEMBLY_ACC=CAM_ASM_000379 /LENGTH=93 /DNA_ID=CAMNT_0028184813 /DNA_START=71 /DNA_END=352 /DNA_ORIENTATION=+